MHKQTAGSDEPRPKFPFGQIVATPNALNSIHEEEMMRALGRHLIGDWGTLDNHDWNANERAFRNGGRLFSAYDSDGGIRFWIITEADRSVTTILLPEDY